MASFPSRFVSSIARPLAALAVVATLGALAGQQAQAAEDPKCLSPDPTQWPSPSKPYFMFVIDNSGSMTTSVGSTPSCGAAYGTDRIGHARCAVRNTVAAYAGEVNFGLATYAEREIACTSSVCPTNSAYAICTHSSPVGTDNACGTRTNDPGIGLGNNIHKGGYVVVPLLQDHYWMLPPSASNVPSLQALVDNNCQNGAKAPDNTIVDEIGAQTNTPIAGSLFSLNQYFSGTYLDPFSGAAVASPLGTIAEGERSCRPINIIFLTDGDETCDCPAGSCPTCATGNCVRSVAALAPIAGGCAAAAGAYPNVAGEALAAYEADKLFHTGVSATGTTGFNVKTYVIGFAGADQAALDHVAACGGTTKSFSTANESDISIALSTIIASAIKPETCDNTDNNCNGCTDEGFTHFCDTNRTPTTECCNWCVDPGNATCNATPPAPTNAQLATRNACLTTYQASITPANPQGDLTKLPCTTPAQSQDPRTWLCFDPGEKCDNLDNNCDLSNGMGTVDEGVTKCAYRTGPLMGQLHCPGPETCNCEDDDCNGIVDDPPVCGTCNRTSEVCDGCDNDCDGIVDDNLPPGMATIPCGFPPGTPNEPAWCTGTQSCLKAGQVVAPGTCLSGGGYGNCTVVPRPEVCNGIDDDCNGVVDDNIPSVDCVPVGTDPSLVYDTQNPASVCHKGKTICTNGTTQCVGFVGPSAEVCDGLDNNCDGNVDEGVLPGTGGQCGVSRPPCSPGRIACVNGSLTCQGGIMPQPEICDGIDNNCNGEIDEAPLVDGPAAGMNGCWPDPGNCCTFPATPTPNGPPQFHWCPPPGATCEGLGSLTGAPEASCHAGVLVCKGAAGWSCTSAVEPSPEVCDGLDNDCNGAVDDGNLVGVNQICGTDVGECKTGITQCNSGVITCVGSVGPTPEVCDGKDNDCDGIIDNGIPIGGPCTPQYDTMLYPGDRTHPPCQPGHYECDGSGNLKCVGGIGPTPEICDGLDNDCDGQIDEVGTAPDGINGSANPHPPPAANIGEACGGTVGECKPGVYGCVNGQFSCIGGQTKQPEVCDCIDNDCDGTVDNSNPNNMPALCSTGKDCVRGASGCQCASKCSEVGCPAGQKCEMVVDSSTGQPKGEYCLIDESQLCGDCGAKTVMDANGKVVCAPAGTVLDGCVTPPVCICKGQSGCQDPCLFVQCDNNTVCATAGPNAGTCVQDNCFNVPCQGCAVACNLGSCQQTKCDPDPCQADEECVPNLDPGDPTGYTCVKSCAGVTCASGKTCVQGTCKPTCVPDCPAGQYCDTSGATPACLATNCGACSDGSCCDDKTGSCGHNCPCNGVVCPSGQVCVNDSCVEPSGTGGGGASSASATASSSHSASASGSSSASGTGGASTGAGIGGNDDAVWGQATGGGGCQCELGDEGPGPRRALAVAFAALAAIWSRRRRRALASRKGVAS